MVAEVTKAGPLLVVAALVEAEAPPEDDDPPLQPRDARRVSARGIARERVRFERRVKGPPPLIAWAHEKRTIGKNQQKSNALVSEVAGLARNWLVSSVCALPAPIRRSLARISHCIEFH